MVFLNGKYVGINIPFVPWTWIFLKCFTDFTAVNHHEKPPFGIHSTKNEVFKREKVRRQFSVQDYHRSQLT